ncbi:MAG: NAD(P)/FAD-dependent oxidoreductase [Thermofilaceae archaeon]
MKVAIVGAGVVGASIARVLSAYEGFEVTLIERMPDVGWGVSKANTSIIHPGHEEDPRVHPLRAKLCVEGNRLWREWIKELEIPARWPGELMVFSTPEEEREALKYIELARVNGVPGVRPVYGRELKALEPLASDSALGAVYAPTAGTISPFEAVVAIVENAVENGVRLLTETEVERVVVEGGGVKGVETSRGFIEADVVVNAAGLYADEISRSAGVEEGFRIRPRRGEYVIFDENVPLKPLRILHTVPTPVTKGVYALTTVHGNLLLGPTAEDLPYEAKEDTSTTAGGVELVLREASRLLRELPPRSRVIRTFAGLRPEPPGGEWLIRAYEDPWGFVNVAGIRSPGLTAAPAIARYVVELIAKTYDVELRRKRRWNPRRRGITRVADRSLEEIDALARENPDYGEIVCGCRMVSKAEILEAVERIRRIGARVTLDGIKFRAYAGLGRCQGSFCRWRIALIVSELTGQPLHAVPVATGPYGYGDVKALLRGGAA